MINIDEDVHVVPPDPTWGAKFIAERARIVDGLGDSDTHLEHIGSTAVPGLHAKPVVDMMLGTSSYPPAARQIETIAALGYENMGEAGVPGRLYFRRRGTTSYNLHVVAYLGAHWRNNLKLRDYLAHNAVARARYAAVKLEVVRAGATRLIAYSEAKAHIVNELLDEATRPKNASEGRAHDQ